MTFASESETPTTAKKSRKQANPEIGQTNVLSYINPGQFEPPNLHFML